MRYRLRTLLIVLAVGPAILAAACLHIQSRLVWGNRDNLANANYVRSKSALDTGFIHLGMAEDDFLETYRPYATHYYGQFAVFDLGPPNGYYGCTIIAKRRQLVHAVYSECTMSREYFSALTPAEVGEVFAHLPPP